VEGGLGSGEVCCGDECEVGDGEEDSGGFLILPIVRVPVLETTYLEAGDLCGGGKKEGFLWKTLDVDISTVIKPSLTGIESKSILCLGLWRELCRLFGAVASPRD
jgi:hypothetical protein